ncbi:MAG: hypothetical protein ACE5FF_18325 [Saprospiraceae bacterium]
MKNQHALLLILALAFISCTNPPEQGNNDLDSRVGELEKKIENLQKELADQELRTRISYNLSNVSPLKDFFLQSDEFWKNPVDVSLVECHKTCAELYKKKSATCFKLPRGRQRIVCLNAIDVSDCYLQCQKDHLKVD